MLISGWKEWMIAAMTALGVYMMYMFSGSFGKIPHIKNHFEDSYEMARTRNSFWNFFDLSGREIDVDRTEVATANKKEIAPKKGTPVKEDPKKATADAKKKSEEAKKKADAKKKSEELARRQQMTVRVIGENTKSTWGQDSPRTYPQSSSTVNFQQPKTQVPPAEDTSDNHDEELSPSQWLSLLQAQPNSANAKKFIAAKGQIGDKHYYEILLKLLQDSQSDRQKFALAILNADVSVSTFQFLVHSQAEVSAKVDVSGSSLTAILKSYGSDKSRFGVLALALGSSDVAVVLEAETQVVIALQNLGQNPNVTRKDFEVFKTVMSRLTKKSNPQVAQIANQIFSSLWPQDFGTATASLPAN